MTSGSILRGSLRPGGGRTPPFLIIGLLVICGILGFNYWNLSAEYDTLVKEIGDLQDKFRIVALKREHAEKQSEAVERRFNEAEAEIGKIKIAVFQKDQELTKAGAKIERQNDELEKLRDQLAACQALNVQINSSKEKLEDLRKKLDESTSEKVQLQGEKQKLITERQDMRLKLEELTFKLSQFSQPRGIPRQQEQPIPVVPGKNSVQEQGALTIQPAADEKIDTAGNGEDLNPANNEQKLQAVDTAQEPVVDNGKDENRPNDKLLVVPPDPQHQQEHNASRKNMIVDTVEQQPSPFTENIQNNEVQPDSVLPEKNKNSSLRKRMPSGGSYKGTGENIMNTEVASNHNAYQSNGGISNDLEANNINTEVAKPVELPSNQSAHPLNDNINANQVQAEGHDNTDHLQTEGLEMIHGHKVGDSMDDHNVANQVEPEGTDQKTKETPQIYDAAFVREGNALREANNFEVNGESKTQPVKNSAALDEPGTNHENEAIPNTNLTDTVKEADNVAIANPDVDYPLKQSAPGVGQENLSGNAAGLGGGEEIPQSMHAIPHAKDNGDYVDSKNAMPGMSVPKPSDDEREGEDNDNPADKMKDTLKLPAEQTNLSRDKINDNFNRHHNIPANIHIVGKSDRHPGLFSPFRNEGTLGQEKIQS